MKSLAVQFLGVGFGYEGSKDPLFRDLSFSIEEGGYVGVVGGNGTGKTTALRLMLGLLRSECGEIRLFGQSIDSFKEWDTIGYVPQYVFQHEHAFPATVREIVESGHLSGPDSSLCQFGIDRCQPVEEALRIAEISHLSNRLIGELSGGERQRVFIARALVSRPRLLVLDEPTANVDAESQNRFFRFLASLNTSGMTIVLVSHDLDAVFRHAKTIFVLEDGAFRWKTLQKDNERIRRADPAPISSGQSRDFDSFHSANLS